MYIDTHAHLYLNTYKNDVNDVIKRAQDNFIKKIFLPNIDMSTIHDMLNLCNRFPRYLFPMIGIHPNSIKQDFETEIKAFDKEIATNPKKYIAIGEIGIDLYRNSKYLDNQKKAFKHQIETAIKLDMPIVIHTRDSFDVTIKILDEYKNHKLKGVFHCFTGNETEAKNVIDRGFKLGIGGVVTFKNSKLSSTLSKISLDDIVLETDAPFLTPDPYRGKRNESSYMPLIAKKLSEIYSTNILNVSQVTLKNTNSIFYTDD
ncbi:MAG: TatD family hydrolase [Marinilabiliales bacterium]